MNHAESLRGLLDRVPSIEERIKAFPKIAFISRIDDTSETVFGRKPEGRYFYDYTTQELHDVKGNVIPFSVLRETFGPEDGMIVDNIQARAVTAQLHKYGLDTVMDITHYAWRGVGMLDQDKYRNNLDSIRTVFSLLDAQSAEILYSMLCFRILLDPKILRFSNYPQYFHPKILPFMQETIIDGGAFTGDTAIMFSKNAYISADVYAFEPDYENYNKMFTNIHIRGLHNFIHPFPWGLWSERTTLSFFAGAQSSMITEDGLDRITTVDIDSFCQRHHISPTVIKLDVEGAELHALRGAEQVIRQGKPKLLISLYHVAEDLWQLPLLIKSYRDDYTFHIGHHSPDLTIYETVLYAY